MSDVAKLLIGTGSGDQTRNYIINGDFYYDQRYCSTSSSKNSRTGTMDGYMLDRWYYYWDETNVTGTDIYRDEFTLGQTDVPGDPKYYHTLDFTSVAGDGTAIQLAQRIESVRSLAGKKVGVSFYAKGDSAFQIGIRFNQHFGTTGSPSSDNLMTQQSINLSTSWHKYELQFDIDSIAGKTLGTDDNDYLELRFNLPVNATFIFDLANVMVCEGNPKPFRLAGEDHATELALCQRYYEKSYDIEEKVSVTRIQGIVDSLIISATVWNSFVKFATNKRSQPTFIAYGYNGVINQGYYGSGYTTFMSAGTAGHSGAIMENTGTKGTRMQYHWTADAEL